MSDIESSNFSETAASNNAASPNGFPSGSTLPSQVAPIVREFMAATKREWDRSHPTVTSGGTANAQTLTYSVAPAAYVQGQILALILPMTCATEPSRPCAKQRLPLPVRDAVRHVRQLSIAPRRVMSVKVV